ncbi:DNA methyltransferase [Nonomuraea pusilla]|uniref:DNA methylase n=1 Tax=Nonomuraea pusilla TaxID=46177 RepID=A0A1H8K5J5_9ACTN|nr:DNA methyltransferase [Nonomuraea pusilla]SEN87957.1 DNA methylase [Nonomuraea pusilla]
MTEPYWSDDTVTLYVGDCREVLAAMPDASVDAIVTDPPYELAFMGRAWDASGIAFDPAVWRECLRVLKPGGHLLAFGAPRAYHRMAVAVEDAGFEIRDSIHWVFGSGFPKGQDMGKAIDRRREDRTKVLQVTAWLAAARDAAGWTNAQIDALWGYSGMGGLWTTQGKAAIVPRLDQWDRIRDSLGFDDTEIRPLVVELNERKGRLGESLEQREVVGTRSAATRKSDHLYGNFSGDGRLTLPSSEAAHRWDGWNTALKPAHEPIVLARKSTGFNSTVANILEWGTGALNIAACRTPVTAEDAKAMDRVNTPGSARMKAGASPIGTFTRASGSGALDTTQGRWPTNFVITHSALCAEDEVCQPDCPVAELDRQSGTRRSGGDVSGNEPSPRFSETYGESARARFVKHRDAGGASRFFPTFRYEAKAPSSERPRLADGTAHATVKPLALMRWLVRLVTPPGGLVLDPFAGSGTTGEACALEGFRAVLVELEKPHAELIKRRLSKPLQPSLDLFSMPHDLSPSSPPDGPGQDRTEVNDGH